MGTWKQTTVGMSVQCQITPIHARRPHMVDMAADMEIILSLLGTESLYQNTTHKRGQKMCKLGAKIRESALR